MSYSKLKNQNMVGSVWKRADGGPELVTITGMSQEGLSVYYVDDEGLEHERDTFGFSTRYDILDEDDFEYGEAGHGESFMVDENDGQPTMYEEYQDLFDGDDNFLDHMAEDGFFD